MQQRSFELFVTREAWKKVGIRPRVGAADPAPIVHRVQRLAQARHDVRRAETTACVVARPSVQWRAHQRRSRHARLKSASQHDSASHRRSDHDQCGLVIRQIPAKLRAMPGKPLDSALRSFAVELDASALSPPKPFIILRRRLQPDRELHRPSPRGAIRVQRPQSFPLPSAAARAIQRLLAGARL